MVDYAHPRTDAEDLTSGIRTFSLQPPRSDRARHARVGEAIHLRIGSAAQGERLPGICIARATVHIHPDGLRRVLDETRLGTGPGADQASGILARFINAEDGSPNAEAEREKLARQLGHTGWADMVKDARHTGKGKGELKGNVIVRELIGWRLT